jgi:DNA repair protein SbcC/Rad50
VRLHRLEVQALQAFAEREVVDFDALGAAGLFLLHGDTGAGKTTLLDAVCFAFYGKLPGARGKDARERSDHAAAELRTHVVLEATLRGERLRITRTPKQERPKRRGTGTTEEAATVHLEREEGDGWRTLATRHEEAAAELDRLLGMSREQFCQVVLLPQGEFATFLRADSDTRWEVLERLFATERFSVAEDVLTRRRKEAGAELEAARASVRAVAQRLCQETGCESEPDWEDAPVLLGPWLQERLVGAEASLITAGSVCERAGRARSAADVALRDADALAERARRHAEARAAVVAYEARRPERDAAAAELFAARQAAAVAPLLADGDRLAAQVTQAERAATAALEPLGVLTGEPDGLRQAAAQLRARAGEVDALGAVEADLSARRAALAEEERRAAVAGAEADQAQQQLTQGPAERARLTQAYETASAAAAGLAGRIAAAQEAHRRHEAAAERDRFQEELERTTTLRSAAVGAEQTARGRWLDVRQARLDGMAAELARGLADGEACLVCGATEHPAPATVDGAAVDADAERAAQQAHETADARVRALDARLAELRPALAAATATAGIADRAALVQAAQEADRARDAARRASAEVADCAAAVQALEAEQSGLAAKRVAAAEVAAAARARALAWRAELDADADRLRAALEGAASVAARVHDLRVRAAAQEAAAEALTAAARARDAAGQARARLLDAARAAGFTDLATARGAVRDADACVDLEERLRAFDDALAERRGLVADPELQAAAGAPQADLDALRAAALAAANAQAQAERDHEVAARHAEALRRLEHQLVRALDVLAPVAAHAKHVRELAFLVDGSAAANRKRMRLSAYVLAARLEEIAAAASVRLAAMTDDRYTIEHSDAGAKGQKRGGLDLRILDAHTGRHRHPATLSGGETFLASLALALGLADVVEAESGGARLETLFVDEGFGSLDAGSLDMVLDVLDRLRDGGRSVGIVSHVGELRQRIPTQLHVVKGRAGSHVHQATAA